MIKKNQPLRDRFIYALLVLIVITAGILSRKTTMVPLFAGDLLYAVMMFLIIRFLLIRSGYQKIAIISLAICYGIELAQLYNAPWINQLRSTTLGALVLGRGFLWSDMAAYTAGIAICVFIGLSPALQAYLSPSHRKP
ncbi:DUF2809 domain-containing protein [Pedobacter sp. PLR]|uniref:ribosomal maturation YjgA family protein n=1 Tax=Pedobacter sp. PLR TaxID=2994465 RepID=UPI0022468D29|nr:DUF2809 domain-containing protein [Pedobacter sp. PLR]MCX2452562.1 DUF2809 domain-containing protein [Pedobacter sp. PLR]